MEHTTLLSTVSKAYQSILGNNLCGIYVHGSIAFGCFCWDTSDIDFLVVVYEDVALGQKEAMIRTLLELTSAAPPKGFEMSVVLKKDCEDFSYPTPFLLHFSNAHLKRAMHDLTAYCQTMNGTDADLAAHFTVTKKVGVFLVGKPIAQVFGDVPKADYLASIKADIENAEDDILGSPIYIILNLCRVLAYMKDGLILSKAEGGKWGAANLPQKYAALIQQALDCYVSGLKMTVTFTFSRQFASYMKNMIFHDVQSA